MIGTLIVSLVSELSASWFPCECKKQSCMLRFPAMHGLFRTSAMHGSMGVPSPDAAWLPALIQPDYQP